MALLLCCTYALLNIGSDNGLSPGRHQAIIWNNVGILLIGPLGTNFCEILIKIDTFSFTKIHLKMPSGKWRPFCPGLNVLTAMYIFCDLCGTLCPHLTRNSHRFSFTWLITNYTCNELLSLRPLYLSSDIPNTGIPQWTLGNCMDSLNAYMYWWIIFYDWYHEHYLQIFLQVNTVGSYWW